MANLSSNAEREITDRCQSLLVVDCFDENWRISGSSAEIERNKKLWNDRSSIANGTALMGDHRSCDPLVVCLS